MIFKSLEHQESSIAIPFLLINNGILAEKWDQDMKFKN